MNIIRKLLLATFALAFVFVIVSAKEPSTLPSYKPTSDPIEETQQEELRIKERHHCRW